MRHTLVILFALLFFLSFASLPSRQSIRFNEVNAENMAPRSVGNKNLQTFSVDSNNLVSEAVSYGKLGNWVINKEQLAPGAVTSAGLAFDVVKLVIKDQNTIVSPGMAYPLPNGIESPLPVENVYFQQVIVDNPNPEYAYKVSSFARGPGTILGWYPTKNAHLLRYQSGRALHGIVCAESAILNINHNTACQCAHDFFFDQFFDPIDGVGFGVDVGGNDGCGCNWEWFYTFTDWGLSSDGNSNTNFNCYTECTSLFGCWDILGNWGDTVDPRCFQTRTSLTGVNQHTQEPDRCGSFTSVEDVNNPQEGIPLYTESVESIEIDNLGKVTLSFFGRGSVLGPSDEIEISVVILLNEQYGA